MSLSANRLRPSLSLWTVLSALLSALLSAGLGGCLPTTDSILPLQFSPIPQASGLELVNPPLSGTAEAEAVFRLRFEVRNPNSFQLRLAGLTGDFALGARRVPAQFEVNADLGANRTQPVDILVRLPLTEEGGAVNELRALAAGQPTRYSLSGAPQLSFRGLERSLAPLRLAETTLRQPLTLKPPELRYNPSASGLSEVSGNEAVVTVEFELHNVAATGYEVALTDLELALQGRRVSRAEPLLVTVLAGERRRVRTRFRLDKNTLSALSRAAGAEGVAFEVSAATELNAGALGQRSLAKRVVLRGVMD